MKHPAAWTLALILIAGCSERATVTTAPSSRFAQPSPLEDGDGGPGGCGSSNPWQPIGRLFPANNVWNRDISTLPVHASSATWIAKLQEGKASNAHAWCGWAYPNYGMNYATVCWQTPRIAVPIVGQSQQDSDHIPYPFTADTPIEQGTSDKHAFMYDAGQDSLFEFYYAAWNAGAPTARATVAWDLGSNALRPDNRSSADEAGLPLFVGLARWDEVAAGAINHALRFEVESYHMDGSYHLWPARHSGGTGGSDCPPMGARIRLKASYSIAWADPRTQVLLRAWQHYGLFLADIGDYTLDMQGTVDPAWPSIVLSQLFQVPTSAFEFVDESGLIVNPNTAEAAQ